jgi:fluoride exporter
MTAARRMMLVASGGALGGVARLVIGTLVGEAAGRPDWSVVALLVINLSGSLLAGLLRGLLERRTAEGRDGARLDAFLLVGFCGGFTSYSGFVATVVAGSAWISAATLVLCPCAALLGMRLSGGYPARPAGSPR